MKIFLLLIGSLFLISCGRFESKKEQHRLSKNELVIRARNKAISNLKKEKELYPFGGGGQVKNEIQSLFLAFNYYNSIDLEKSRELLLAANHQLVNSVNEDPEIRQYLANYPFDAKNIEIEIYVRNLDGSNPTGDNLSVITLVKGVLTYRINDAETKRFKTIFEETYEEAITKHSDGKNN